MARVLEEGITELLTSQLGTVSHMPPELLHLEERRLSVWAENLRTSEKRDSGKIWKMICRTWPSTFRQGKKADIWAIGCLALLAVPVKQVDIVVIYIIIYNTIYIYIG